MFAAYHQMCQPTTSSSTVSTSRRANVLPLTGSVHLVILCYYDVPSYTIVGGVGIYVKYKFTVMELHDYKINSNDKVKVENIWLEVSQSDSKYIIGGIYRHPNSSILDFYSATDPVLCKISSQNILCFIAVDINIDLIKCRTN